MSEQKLQEIASKFTSATMDEFCRLFAYDWNVWTDMDDNTYHGRVVLHQRNMELLDKPENLFEFGCDLDLWTVCKVEVDELAKLLRQFDRMKVFI